MLRNHDRFFFSTMFAVHGLTESMEKRSFVLFRVLGSPLCQWSVRMVSHSSKALTNTFLWQRHFWMSCVKFPGYVRKQRRLEFRLFFCTRHLSRYSSYEGQMVVFFSSGEGITTALGPLLAGRDLVWSEVCTRRSYLGYSAMEAGKSPSIYRWEDIPSG